MWWYLILGFVLLSGAVYWLLLTWEAKASVSEAPKEKMYSCEKHGLFLEKYAMQVGDDLIQQYPDGHEEKGPMLYCPFCFEDRINEAKHS